MCLNFHKYMEVRMNGHNAERTSVAARLAWSWRLIEELE